MNSESMANESPESLTPSFDALKGRPFSFYPPIAGIEHNEWLLREAGWSEILVANPKLSLEIWIPRSYFAGTSRVDEPVVILGLNRELEYKGGAVWPAARRVIEMPKSIERPADSPALVPAPPVKPGKAPVVNISLGGAESTVGRLVLGVMAVGLIACVLVVSYFSQPYGQRIRFIPVIQSPLGLTASDDYDAVVRRLGRPDEDRWKSESEAIQYRLLRFRSKGVSVILMGKDRQSALYVGALNDDWRPVDSVEFGRGGNTRDMLRGLQRF